MVNSPLNISEQPLARRRRSTPKDKSRILVKMAFGARGYHAVSRYLLVAFNIAIFASSAIIVGILAYFLRHWPGRGVHLIFQLVVVSLAQIKDT